LNFANRTKKIEVNEIENEPIFKGPTIKTTAALGGALGRQPLRLLTSQNVQVSDTTKRTEKQIIKTFSVYPDKSRTSSTIQPSQRPGLAKRPLEHSHFGVNRPIKIARTSDLPKAGMSKQEIEDLIERRLEQKLAEKTLSEQVAPAPTLSGDLQRRLDALEERVAHKEDSEGLQYLLMAKQHQARGEDTSALKMYQLAQPFFPRNEKLARKILLLQDKVHQKRDETLESQKSCQEMRQSRDICTYDENGAYEDDGSDRDADNSFQYTKPKAKKTKIKAPIYRDNSAPTPRTKQLLQIINSRDIAQIKLLKGVGMKKAESIVNSLFDMASIEEEGRLITDLEALGALKGVGWKTVENMRAGLGAAAV
jgi:DNA uptake protein ComE-like DNA-binding protein